MIYTVASLKGGGAKTTTATHLAAAMERRGQQVVLIDADPQGSALTWAERADFPWLTVSMPTRTIHLKTEQLLIGREHLVIDTPPGDIGVITSAMRAAAKAGGVLIVPVQPTTADLDKVSETIELAQDAGAAGDLHIFILLTRVVLRTKAVAQIRVALESFDVDVLQAEVRQSQVLALAHGQSIDELGDYAEVLDEITRKVSGNARQ